MATELLDGIKLVACDLDGTLLKDGAKEVPPEAFPVIERFCDTGNYFFAASGRPYASLRWLFEPVADRIGYVCENGTLAAWQGETLYSVAVDRDLILDACYLAESIPDCKYFVSCKDTAFVPAHETKFIAYARNVVHANVTPIEKPEDYVGDALKICFSCDEAHNSEICQKFQERYGDAVDAVTSGNRWVDVLPQGVNKATAINAAADVLGLTIADIAGFGDEENDRAMLETVGHPYLMNPCRDTMLNIMERPNAKRCTLVADELKRLMGE